MTSEGSTFSIKRRRLDHPDALTLIDQVQAEYVERYGGGDESPIAPAHFEEPRGCFFLGYLGGAAIAMGGWRRHDVPPDVKADSVGEIKRMYVRPDCRGCGFARAILTHVEFSARAAGIEALILETGSRQPEAHALYESSGYVAIGPFGHNARFGDTRFYAKPLIAS